MSDKKIKKLEEKGIDPEQLILDLFQYYKDNRGKQCEDIDKLTSRLIHVYFDLNRSEINFDNMKKSFVRRYCTSETTLEGVDFLTNHGRDELHGMKTMYEYMHSPEMDDKFDIFSIKDLHEKLYSHTPYPEFGGNFRRDFAYLQGARTDLCDPRFIFRRLDELNEEVLKLRQIAPQLRALRNPDLLLQYLKRCVQLNCKMVRIHPFADGNGRTIRCFTNKLLEDAGLPSVYVKPEEREEYLAAMRKGMDEENYSDIFKFYRYKVCDSIIELDVNERLKRKNQISDPKIKKKSSNPSFPSDPGDFDGR